MVAASSHQLWVNLGLVKAEPVAAGEPWIIYITASTGRVDHEGERVLPQALKAASEYFLRRGKVTFEHIGQDNRHDATILIGEPLAMQVTADGRTLVQARLYQHQPQAQAVWNILQSGGKMGASIGGAVLHKQALPGQPPIIDRLMFNHLAITSWPMNEDTEVQLTPYADFLAKALGAADASAVVMEDLEGARLRGTADFTQKWRALAAQLQEQYDYDEDKAKQMALAVLIVRGEARQAFVAHSMPVTSQQKE